MTQIYIFQLTMKNLLNNFDIRMRTFFNIINIYSLSIFGISFFSNRKRWKWKFLDDQAFEESNFNLNPSNPTTKNQLALIVETQQPKFSIVAQPHMAIGNLANIIEQIYKFISKDTLIVEDHHPYEFHDKIRFCQHKIHNKILFFSSLLSHIL